MKILTVRSKGVIAPHVMDGFIKAIQMSGYEHSTIDVASGFGEQHFSEIQRFKPDFVLGYDFSGYIQTPDGFLLRQLGMPLIALHYDNPFYAIDNKLDAELRNYPENYYNFIWDSYYLDAYREEGYKNGFPILLATDVEAFHSQPIDPSNSFAFVGDIRFDGLKIAIDQPPIIRAYIEMAIDLKVKHFAVPLHEICRGLIERPIYAELKNESTNDPGIIWRLHYLIHQYGTHKYRYNILDGIHDDEVHLYGTDNWQKDNIICHAKINYGSDLSKVYQQHAVNLNLSSLQLETSVNNRVFDCFASNAFVLSDYKRDMELIFPDCWRNISFANADELAEKARYYLSHAPERRALTYELHKQILQNHTYNHRLHEILQAIKRKSAPGYPIPV
jgi:spore maturation protein CgeB